MSYYTSLMRNFISQIIGKLCDWEFLHQLLRFGIVGIIATFCHYSVYLILQRWVNASIAYSLGYALSFICNFILTCIFTFKSNATVKKGFGFGIAHLTNYILHIVLLNFCLWLGLSNEWAPLPVFCIAIPVNFLLVRLVFVK